MLVEGQEDVVFYSKALDQLAEEQLLPSESVKDLKECLFGWGAGGANKIEKILALLNDLGFERVTAIFDKNKADLIPRLAKIFTKYYLGSIPADDVRTKEKVEHGLLNENGVLRMEFKAKTTKLFKDIIKHIKL